MRPVQVRYGPAVGWDDSSLERYSYWRAAEYIVGVWLTILLLGPFLLVAGSVAWGIVFAILGVASSPIVLRWWRRKWRDRPRKPTS